MLVWLSTLEAELAQYEAPKPPRPEPGADLDYLADMYVWILLGAIALGMLATLAVIVVRRRRIARSPRLVEGTRVTISGVVQAPATLEAALSGRPCVMHRSRARVLVHTRLISEPREVEIAPFVVATRHGQIRVDVREIELDVPPESVVGPESARQRAFRERHAIPQDAAAAFDEIVIEPGAKVTIRGIVAIERELDAKGERGYRDDAPTTIHLVGSPAKPVALLKQWQ